MKREIFFCKECGGLAKGTIYDIAINKRFCSVHETEEVIDLSGEHSSLFPIFLYAMMHPEWCFQGGNKGSEKKIDDTAEFYCKNCKMRFTVPNNECKIAFDGEGALEANVRKYSPCPKCTKICWCNND